MNDKERKDHEDDTSDGPTPETREGSEDEKDLTEAPTPETRKAD